MDLLGSDEWIRRPKRQLIVSGSGVIRIPVFAGKPDLSAVIKVNVCVEISPPPGRVTGTNTGQIE